MITLNETKDYTILKSKNDITSLNNTSEIPKQKKLLYLS